MITARWSYSVLAMSAKSAARRSCALSLALCVLALSAVPAGAADSASSSPVRYVSVGTVKAWLDAGEPVAFLDVRAADEFAAGHLPDAINIHYDQVAARVDQLPHDRPIVVYCIHSAHRAPLAAHTLNQLGFENAVVLEGGIVAWDAGGLTIRASDLAQAPNILPKTERCDQANTL